MYLILQFGYPTHFAGTNYNVIAELQKIMYMCMSILYPPT